MAHKVLLDEPVQKTQKKYTMPTFNGKFGFAFFIAGKEFFVGLAVSDIVLEQVVRRKFVKSPKAGVKTFRFDPL